MLVATVFIMLLPGYFTGINLSFDFNRYNLKLLWQILSVMCFQTYVLMHDISEHIRICCSLCLEISVICHYVFLNFLLLHQSRTSQAFMYILSAGRLLAAGS